MMTRRLLGSATALAAVVTFACGGEWRPPSLVSNAAVHATATVTEQQVFISAIRIDGSLIIDLKPSDLTVREDGATRTILRLETAGPAQVFGSSSTPESIIAACQKIIANPSGHPVIVLSGGFVDRPDDTTQQQISDALRQAHAAVWLVTNHFTPFGEDDPQTTTTHSGRVVESSDPFRESPESHAASRGFAAAKSLAEASGGRFLDITEKRSLDTMLAAEYRVTYTRPAGTKLPDTLSITDTEFRSSVTAPRWAPR
jgi:hypothetical protein